MSGISDILNEGFNPSRQALTAQYRKAGPRLFLVLYLTLFFTNLSAVGIAMGIPLSCCTTTLYYCL